MADSPAEAEDIKPATPEEFKAITSVENDANNPPLGVGIAPEILEAHREAQTKTEGVKAPEPSPASPRPKIVETPPMPRSMSRPTLTPEAPMPPAPHLIVEQPPQVAKTPLWKKIIKFPLKLIPFLNKG